MRRLLAFHRFLIACLVLSLLFPLTGGVAAQADRPAAERLAASCAAIRGADAAQLPGRSGRLGERISAPATTETAVYTITASSDDASRYLHGFIATTEITNTEMKLGVAPSDSGHGGYRFAAVNWPSGAQLVAARFTLKASSSGDAELSELRVYGEAADSASTYTTSEDFTQRTLTSRSVLWAPGKWPAGQVKGIDVTGVISEVLHRPAWSSGNPVALQVWAENGGFAYVWSWDGNRSGTASLTLTYTVSLAAPLPAGCVPR